MHEVEIVAGNIICMSSSEKQIKEKWLPTRQLNLYTTNNKCTIE